MELVGRTSQLKTVEYLLHSPKSEFVAVIGRRRVGKTFFIDKAFQHHFCFRMTGIQDGTLSEQLINFSIKLTEYMKAPFVPPPPDNWQQAFYQLRAYLQSLDTRKKHVIFIDELPWVETPRSRFLKMLAHFWNDFLSKENHFILVICGSATSWITDRVINDRGGLHNRLSQTIRLKPFTLGETKEFLKSRDINLPDQEITKLYMALGGIPYYLENIRKGETAATAIERICFHPEGILKNEYENLYKALFYNYKDHERIIKALSKSQAGLTREALIKSSKVKDGGTFNRTMEDLLLSDFVVEYTPYGKIKRGSLYRVQDEFSIFHNRFIQPNKSYTKGIWQQMAGSQSYKIWTGYAFEAICFKHIDKIKEVLGIAGVLTEISSFRKPTQNGEAGFQIDLIISRKDNAINICEVKYYDGPYKMDAQYANKLRERKQRFIEATKTRAVVFTTLITNLGITRNAHALHAVDAEIELKELMKK